MLHPAALLSAEESRAADRAAIDSGISGEKLMENAARAALDVICQQYQPAPVLIVCGNGNNGGDGFVLARLLDEMGWSVTVALTGDDRDIRGDARKALDRWKAMTGEVAPFEPALLSRCGIVVDAIFGTGLSRDIEGGIKKIISAVNESRKPVLAIDIASGINADNGAIMGAAVRASHTVTFVRAKPGHVLLPGKAHSGQVHVFDIGISADDIKPGYYLNQPELWRAALPIPDLQTHKYTRGHALVIGGGIAATGAGRLAAAGALRSGAGLVSIGCTQESLPVYAAAMTAVMTKPVNNPSQLETLLEDKRITSVLIGPGCGTGETTRSQTLQILSHKKPCVIDADAISAFKNSAASLFEAIKKGSAVLTPHEGEFERLFDAKGTKTERAAKAAKQSGAVIVLKGNDTVIAAPDGRIAINANAPVWLATAGSGDVLAGMITGLLAQGMPAFESACAGVWMHGEAANAFGPGLIAEDIPAAIPLVLKKLYYG